MKYLIFIWKKVIRCNAIFFVLILSNLFLIPAYSQIPEECGPQKINMDASKRAKAYAANHANKLLVPAPVLMRVYFHICTNDDGTNAGATEAKIQTEFERLVKDYAGGNICFANMGVNYIKSTQINTNLDVKINEAWLSPYLIPNCINVFYHATLKGNGAAIGGASYAIPNTFCSIARGNIGIGSVSHETGHCMGLLHTHQGCGNSFIDGTDCGSTGDEVCDTPADPWCFNGQSCFSRTGCSYTGTCQDAANKTNWSPPYNNIMSYWVQAGCAKINFTSGQFSRIATYLNSDPGLQDCESPSAVTVSNVGIVGTVMQSAINTLTTSGSVSVVGTANVGLAAGTVFLEPGFQASPLTGGNVLVRPTSCNYLSLKSVAETNSQVVGKSKIVNEKQARALFAYPNPASSEVHLVFDLNKNEKNILVEVYDINARKVKEQILNHLTAGKQNVGLNLRNLPAGVYYVSLQLSTERLTTKVVLNK